MEGASDSGEKPPTVGDYSPPYPRSRRQSIRSMRKSFSSHRPTDSLASAATAASNFSGGGGPKVLQRQLSGYSHESTSHPTARRQSILDTTAMAAGFSAPRDEKLILASLDQQNPEDEAENTLLNILERRQVALTNDEEGISILVKAKHSRKVSMPDMTAGRVGSSMRDLLSTLPPTRRNAIDPVHSISDEHEHVEPSIPPDSQPNEPSSGHFTLPQGLSAQGERAHFVAQQMKANLLENTDVEEPAVLAENDLGDFLHLLEARRELEDVRSQGGSRGSRGGPGSKGVSRSRGNHSRGTGSKGTFSKSEHSSHNRSNRPFSEITSPFAADTSSNIEQMFAAVDCLQELTQIPEGDEDEKVDEGDASTEEDQLADQNRNFLAQLVASHPEITDEEAANLDENTPLKSPQRAAQRARARFWINSNPPKGSWLYKWRAVFASFKRQMGIIAIAFDVQYVKSRLWVFFQNELTFVIVPALATAAALYYRLGNPTLFRTDATVSWFILFLLRNFIALEAAFVSQYLIVEVFVMQSPLCIKLIGPLACLYTINSKGWPFLTTSWALWCLLLIKGRSNWVGFGAVELFTDSNESGGIANATLYTNLLISQVVAGFATSVKRTVLSLYLGRRVFFHYKPKLQKLLEIMCLLTEVADMGSAIDDIELTLEEIDVNAGVNDSEARQEERLGPTSKDMLRYEMQKKTMKKVARYSDKEAKSSDPPQERTNSTEKKGTWNELRINSKNLSDDDESDDEKSAEQTLTVPSFENLKHTESVAVENSDENRRQGTIDEMEIEIGAPPISAVDEPVAAVLQPQASATFQIKSLLENWEEPINKADMVENASILEVIQFRKALAFLDDSHPFGLSFGPASSRDDCLRSAKALYKKLLFLAPGSTVLQFDVIGVLAYNTDGSFDEGKAKALVRLFRPDENNDISLVSFCQSCDQVYKRLRYLRASVGNSTLIDNVLENIFNGAYGFFLILVVLSILQLNPWALLVSLSTVLLSLSFAVGPSAAKVVEGMIMIAVRRPFDLGDKISIIGSASDPPPDCDPGHQVMWIVEDCNLFTTTLRLTRSNEVSTISNGSIANTRIVNHARSKKAVVNLKLPMTLSRVTHEHITIVKSALTQYIHDNPRVWYRLINWRMAKVVTNHDFILFSAQVQHVRPWQDTLPVLTAKGDLEKFCIDIIVKLGIHYDSPPSANASELYIKELPEGFLPQQNGEMDNNKKDD